MGNSLGGWLAAEILVRNQAPFRGLLQLAPVGTQITGVQCGDNSMWGPEEAVRNLSAQRFGANGCRMPRSSWSRKRAPPACRACHGSRRPRARLHREGRVMSWSPFT
jgi:hypothetical protein